MKEYIDHNSFEWNSAGTDITKLWREKYNYIPASEDPAIQEKWTYVKTLPLRNILRKANERK
jgi:hypothetical protein